MPASSLTPVVTAGLREAAGAKAKERLTAGDPETEVLRRNELLLVLEVKLLHCNVSRSQKTFFFSPSHIPQLLFSPFFALYDFPGQVSAHKGLNYLNFPYWADILNTKMDNKLQMPCGKFSATQQNVLCVLKAWQTG